MKRVERNDTSLFNRKKRFLGIEIKDTLIKLVEVEKGKFTRKIMNYSIDDFSPGIIRDGKIVKSEKFEEILHNFLKKVKVKSKKIHLGIHSPHIVLRPMRIAALPKKELRKAIEMEITNNIQLPFEDFVFDYVTLEPPQDESEEAVLHLMLVIAPKPIIQDYVELFQKLKYEVISVDLPPLAIFRLHEWDQEEEMPHTFITINLSQQNTEISIFHQRILRLTRKVLLDMQTVQPMSFASQEGQAINRTAAFADELGNEIERILNFYIYTLNNRNQQLREITIAGDLDEVPEIARILAQRLQVPCKIQSIDRFTLFSLISQEDLSRKAAQLAVPLGLALKEVNQ